MNPDDLYPQEVGLSKEDQWAEFFEEGEQALDQEVPQAAPTEGDPPKSEKTPPSDDEKSWLGVLPQQGKFDSAVEQGARRGFNEMSNTIFGMGQGAARLWQKFRKRPEDEWAEWYTERARYVNPVQLATKENPGGVYGFVEGAAQFATGFLAGGAALRGAKVLQGAGRGMSLARAAAAGAVADYAAFDPWEARLSDMIEAGPEAFRNPVTAYLSADEEDPELLGRAKNALEGLVIGGTLDSVFTGIRVLRKTRAARAGKSTPAEVEKSIMGILEEHDARMAKQDSPVQLREAEDGAFEVIVKEADEVAEAIPPMRYPTQSSAEAVGAVLEQHFKEQKLLKARVGPKRLDIAPEDLASISQVAKRMTESGKDFWDPRHLEGIHFNFAHITDASEAKNLINAISEVLSKQLDEVAGNVRDPKKGWRSNGPKASKQDWAVSRRLAQGIVEGVHPDDFLAAMMDIAGDTKNLPQTVYAAKVMMVQQASQVAQLSKTMELDPTNPFMLTLWGDSMDRLVNFARSVKAVSSDAGRTLNIMKAPVEDVLPMQGPKGRPKNPFAKEAAEEVADEGLAGSVAQKPSTTPVTDMIQKDRPSARQLRALARQIRWTEGDPEAVLRAIRLTSKATSEIRPARAWDNVIGYRAAMMLSGPRTMGVNFVSSTLSAVQVPAEIALGGILSGDKQLYRMGIDMLDSYKPWAEGGLLLKQSWSAFKRAFVTLESSLDPTFIKDEHGMTKLMTQGKQMSAFSHALSLPSRILLATDEFVKQQAYQGHIRAQSLAAVREESTMLGKTFTNEEIGTRVYDDLMHSVDIDREKGYQPGASLNPSAVQHARVTTFTNRLDEGSLGNMLQSAANNNAAVRLIFPFVRTPVNIYRFSAERFPGLGLAMKSMRSDIAAGGSRKAVAQGKQVAGTMIYSMAAFYAMNGNISGNGPDNPQLRAQMLDAGWQPYSVRVGDHWISYRRLEPIATPMALVADAVGAYGELDGEKAEDLMTAMVASMTASVTSKTFLIGASEFFDAIGSGQAGTTKRFLTSFGTSFTPSAMRQTNPDPHWREASTYFQEMVKGTYWSNLLEPRRNIFGEAVLKPTRYASKTFNPFTVTHTDDIDDILMELVELGTAMPMPREKDGNIDLRDGTKWVNKHPARHGQSPYDRMMELMSTSMEGAPSLRTAVTTLMRSEDWHSLSVGTRDYPGSRYNTISGLIQTYTEIARTLMLQEYPSLQQRKIETEIEKVQALIPTL